MANWYYFDKNGSKQGPINDHQLKALAQRGEIIPETKIETEAGKKANASQIKGLKFAARSAPPIVAPAPNSILPPVPSFDSSNAEADNPLYPFADNSIPHNFYENAAASSIVPIPVTPHPVSAPPVYHSSVRYENKVFTMTENYFFWGLFSGGTHSINSFIADINLQGYEVVHISPFQNRSVLMTLALVAITVCTLGVVCYGKDYMLLGRRQK